MKKLLAILLVLLLLVSVLAGCSENKGNNSDATNSQTESTEAPRETAQTAKHKVAEGFAGGSGTAEDPFQISEPGHLVLLHEMLKKEEEEINFDDTYVKGYYIMTADISLNDISDFKNWNEKAPEYGWEPIGADVISNSFAGVFDGNGHKISGMFIDEDGNQTESSRDYYGLFAELKGTVKNLTMEQCYLRTSGSVANVGTIAGYTYEATIDNCNVDNTVIDLYKVSNAGGIAGYGTNVTNCTVSATITQSDDNVVHIGGIAGYGENFEACTFSGILSGNGYTGGIVGCGDNVKNCTNKGTVKGDTVGGISGRVYASGTNLEIENPQEIIENCTNEGQVTGTTLAGGIIGYIGNDESDISMSVINCENKGQVHCDESVAGIIGKLAVERSDVMKVENCVNHMNITGKGKTGGIISEMTGAILHQEGNVVISGCKNLGNITTEDFYSAGIITELLVIGAEVDLNLTVDNCSNEGAIQSTRCAGGILGFSNVLFNAEVSAEDMEISDDTKVTFNKCNNSGNVTVKDSDSMVGGIVGVMGLGYISTDITNCVNTGNVAVDFTLTDKQIEESQGATWTELYQIAGGIVGRIGDGLKLTTAEGVKTSANNVNSENADIVISGCRNTGSIEAPDYSFILNCLEKPLYVNYLGGVVGQCSATNGYAFRVENSTYSNCDRGLGSKDYPDLGTKK